MSPPARRYFAHRRTKIWHYILRPTYLLYYPQRRDDLLRAEGTVMGLIFVAHVPLGSGSEIVFVDAVELQKVRRRASTTRTDENGSIC